MPVKRRPSRYHQPIRQPELDAILEAYGLGSRYSTHHVLFERPAPVALGDRTKTARKIFVDTPDGAFFLKQIPWYCDEPSLNRFRHDWTERLHAAGVPVPMPMRTSRGSAWAEVDGARFTLTRAIVGSAWTGGEGEVAAAMRLLASLHAVKPENPGLATNEDYFDLVADHVTLAQELLEEAGSDPGHALAAAFAPRLARVRDEAAAAGWRALPRTGIHGDFSPWNIVLSEDGRQALACDFDNADHAQRLHDVAEAMFSFGLLRYQAQSTNFDGAARFRPIEAAAAPLRAYQRNAPLEPAERACLPAVGEAFAIEVYCLGLMRGDFSLAQLPLMLDELERLRRDLPGLCLEDVAAVDAVADARPSFDRIHYDFEPWTTGEVTVVEGDFGLPASWRRLAASPRKSSRSGGRSILVAGSCDCCGESFAKVAGPRLAAARIVLPVVEGYEILATSSLGKSDAAAEAVLRRIPLGPGDELVLTKCTRCGANAELANNWRSDRHINLQPADELDSVAKW
ncbi:MAG: phosphotransferase [Alphaproteobacteria bacterium]|nr:phosphotransferase [Alphaproteobacteria bacterium]MBV9371454.1 phosphotransferase [Alphaproteobacteria bacterium]MBV9902391.1 phosphotransferase [Alphaproteobacteria bacterium]